MRAARAEPAVPPLVMMLPSVSARSLLPMSDRRQRIHALVLALLARQSDLDLLDDERGGLGGSPPGSGHDTGNWLERNRRVVQRYQSLVRSAITLDALIEQELGNDQLGGGTPTG